MTAIITCAESRQSLSAVRALGRAQIAVAVGAKKRPALAMWSRFATSTFLTEDPKNSPEGFVEHLADELRGRYATCVLSSRDDAWWAISRFREALPIVARRILPPHYSVVRSLDHEALYHFAESLGISCPKLVPVSAESIEAGIFPDFLYPVRIRPSIALGETDVPTNARMVASSLDELIKLIALHPWLKNGFLVSDYTAVRALSYFGVAEKGQVLVEGFQERLNEYAPHNEVSTLTQTINSVPSIRKSAQVLLAALQWQGPFKVDFIKDVRGGYRLVSLVGRLWGSLELAIKSGVNIPLICYRLAEGTLTKDLLTNAKPHVRLRWIVGDVMAKINQPSQLLFKAKNLMQNFGPKSVHKWWNQERITNYYDVLDVDDPMPFLYELQHRTWRRAMSDSSIE